jgi:AcrR family transcriptional regulator
MKKRAKRPSRVGVRYKKSEATRELLVTTAIQLIATRGLASTSVADIAEAAGVSKGGVHYYFESKDDLYAKVLVKCCDLLEERIIKVFLGGDFAPLERVEHALGEMWAIRRDGVPEMRVLTELHILARQDEPMRQALAEMLKRARRQMIETGLGSMMALGIRPRFDPALIPRLLIATLDGLALHNEVDPVAPSEERDLLKAVEVMAMSLFEV